MTDDTEGSESPSEDKHYEPRRLDKIKQHVKKHQTAYIVAGTAAVVSAGVAVGVVILRSKGVTVNVNLATQKNWCLIGINSPQSNEVTVTMVSKVHPGWVTQCNETQAVFPSQEQAAKAYDIASSNMSAHLNGKLPHAGGKTFTRIRLADLPLPSQDLHAV